MTETTLEASEGRVQSRSTAGLGRPRWGCRPNPWSVAPGSRAQSARPWHTPHRFLVTL